MAGDLHLHSTYSDGSTDIEWVVKFAANTNLSHIAVSDHDTSKSIQFALDNPVYKNLKLIPAVEISCCDTKRERNVHLLCYYPKITNDFLELCEIMKKSRNELTRECIESIRENYPLVPFDYIDNYSKKSDVAFKTHIVRVLCDYGYTNHIYSDLYKSLFFDSDNNELMIPKYPPIDKVMEVIRNMGAVCVVAHPSVYNSLELCEELAQSGNIDGFEVNHMRNTESDKIKLLEIAEKHNLIVTGGTDFHGMHMATPAPIGTYTTCSNEIEKIEQLAKLRR